MSDLWDSQCADFVRQNPSLQQLTITGMDGNLYGSSCKEGRSLQTISLSLKKMASGNLDETSFVFNGDKYIMIRNDDGYVISKSGKKSVICYLSATLCLIGLSVDGDTPNASAANKAMASICDHYKRSSY